MRTSTWMNRLVTHAALATTICVKSEASAHSLSDVAARMAIQAFVTSRIDYCNAALLGLSSASIDRVQHVMNSAARLLLKLPKFSQISVRMRDELHWLPVSLRIQFEVILTMWKCIAWYGWTICDCEIFATYSPQSPTVDKRDPPWQVVSCSKFHEPEL